MRRTQMLSIAPLSNPIRPEGPRGRVAAALVGLALLSVACSDPAPVGQERPSDATASDRSAADPLVGTWERETRCQEVVSVLTQAGLEEWVLEAVAGNGFVPGLRSPDQIADPAHPCEGAVPREHSHFFTDDGRFGSLDWNGEPVDDGTYEVVDGNTFVISKEFPDVTFDYAIDDDTITFEPEIPGCSPDCFEAAWSVSVAYPGEEWHRAG
jgi:hypothetical protein